MFSLGMWGSRTGASSQLLSDAIEHLDPLYAVALRYTKNPSDAEDLVQDTLLRAERYASRFEPGTNLRAWLMKMLTNLFLNGRKTAQRRRVSTEEDLDTLQGTSPLGVAEPVRTPEEMASIGDLSGRITRALDRLPDEHRVVVLLADVEGFSYREIADTLSCPMGTVMSRLHRARKQLQGDLAHHALERGVGVEAEPVSIADWRRRQVQRGQGGET